jgi:DNA-directed RNA polymerase sigma subunit (sigma70/sigma32)
LRRSLGREPTTRELANATDLSPDVVRSLLAATRPETRLDADVDSEGWPATEVASSLVPDPETEVVRRSMSIDVERALRDLPGVRRRQGSGTSLGRL